MQEDSGIKLKSLKVDGGAVENGFLMQFQSDILGVDVHRPEITETTALGAAYLAGLAVGFWVDKNQISDKWKVNKVFTPLMENIKKEQIYKRWKRAMNRALEWELDDEGL